MAMNGAQMGDDIVAAIQALNPNWNQLSGAQQAQLKAYWEAIATAIVNHIKDKADVLPAGSPTTGGVGLQNPAGQPVHVDPNAGYNGTTTAPESLTGTGSIV